MPALTQGQSVDITINGDSTLAIQNPTGHATVESPIGTVVYAGGQANALVDVRSGTARITAVTGGLYWQSTTDPINGGPVTQDPATGALVGAGGPRFVVLGSGMSAEQCHSQIQSALDGGGCDVVVAGQGEFTISDRLYLDDETRLTIQAGCTLRGPDALYHPARMMGLVVNRQALAARSTVTMSAVGSVATIGWTAHGKAVGDPILLLGSVSRGYNGVYLVASVINANTLTVVLDATPEATPAIAVSWGTLQAAAANKFITVQIDGVLDGNGANQPTPGSGLTDRYLGGVFLSGVYRPVVLGSGLINECKGYSVLIAGAAQPVVRDLNIYSSLRDGVHFQGPIRGGLIARVKGYTRDDFTSLTTGDLQSLELTEGEFEGMEVVRPVCTTGATGSAVAFFGKSVWWFAGIKINGADYKGSNSAVMIKGGAASPSQFVLDRPVFLDQLIVRQINWENANRVSGASAIVYISSDPVLPDLLIDQPTLMGKGGANHGRFLSLQRTYKDWAFGTITITGAKNYEQGTASDLVYGAAGVTGGRLVIKDCSIYVGVNKALFNLGGMTYLRELVLDNAASELANSGAYIANLTSGTVDYVTATNNSPKTPANQGNLVFSNGAIIRAVHLLNNSFTGGTLLVGDTSMNVTAGHHIKMTGNTLVNGNKSLILNKACRITANNNVEIGASQGVYDLRGASQVYSVFEGSNVSERTAPFLFAGGATVNVFAPFRQVAVDTAGINRVEGGALWNTNAAAGTLGTAGPVVCLGNAANSWKKVGNYALTY